MKPGWKRAMGERSCGIRVPNGTEGFRWLPGEQLVGLMDVCSEALSGRHVPRYLRITGKQVLLRGKVKLQRQEQQQRQRRACPSMCASGRRGRASHQHHLTSPCSARSRHDAKKLPSKQHFRSHNSFLHSFHLILSHHSDQEAHDVLQRVLQRLSFPFGAAGVETKALKGLKWLLPEQVRR